MLTVKVYLRLHRYVDQNLDCFKRKTVTFPAAGLKIWAVTWDFQQLVCATSKASDQPARTCSLIRAFASRLNILWILSYWLNIIWSSKLKRGLHRLVRVYTCQNATLLKITCRGSNGPQCEKACLQYFTNNTGADQPAHPRRLISAFVIRLLESMISKFASSEISIF